ncbi:MAG: biotin--[acetyl-CoA-carboxylase] ligase [Clostridium sp.]|jgi:BirA family biotin operon repressor/biotin-[acetyl-CoA-carboxylase] ligase|nr:biotin--[acetyl-CoA-carboxylase] ligase [Clostridium sp.]
MKAEILALLRERKDYVSGRELSERFQVTRTAVWKSMNRLKEEGFSIETRQNRGYRLLAAGEVFGKNELESRLRTKWAGKNLKYYAELDSTNTQAKKEAEWGAAHGTLLVADRQTAGRGRRGRGWDSPADTNLYFSLVLKPAFPPAQASMLTLVMAHSVALAVAEESGLEARIKWPNDVVVKRRKCCGILTEMSAELDYIHYVVVGVGINVGKQEFPPPLREKATCLDLESGREISRSVLLAKVLLHFEEDYAVFCEKGDLSGLMESYNRLLVNRGAQVRVLDPKGDYDGTAGGITSTGQLTVETAEGKRVEVYAGEVSVRGIYGYT